MNNSKRLMLATLEGNLVKPDVSGWNSAFEYNDEVTANPYGFGTTLGSYELGFLRKAGRFLWRKTKELVAMICRNVKRVAKTVYTISGLKSIVNIVAKGAQFIGSALKWFYDLAMRLLYRFIYMLAKKTIRARYVDKSTTLNSDSDVPGIDPEQASKIVEYGKKAVNLAKDRDKLKSLQGVTVATVAGVVAVYVTPLAVGLMASNPALVPYIPYASKLIFAMITTAVAYILNELINAGLDALGLTPEEVDLDDANKNSPSYAQIRIAEYDFYKASISTGDEIVVGEIVRKELNRASPYPFWIFFQIENGSKVWYCKTLRGIVIKIDESLTIDEWLASLNSANGINRILAGGKYPERPGQQITLATVLNNPGIIAGFKKRADERARKERMQSMIIPALALTALTLAGT